MPRPRFRALRPYHFLAAGAIALVVLGGFLAKSWQRPIHSFNPALLSFDGAASNGSAVTQARSILDDETVEFLAIRAASSSPSEFWSHLELVQQGPATLLVRYDSPGMLRAVLATNAVADTLAAWTPPAQPAVAPAAPSAPPQETQPQPTASSPKLEKLQQQFQAVNDRLSALEEQRRQLGLQTDSQEMVRLRRTRERLIRGIAAESKRAARQASKQQSVAPVTPPPAPSPQPAPVAKSPFTLVQRASETATGGGMQTDLLRPGALAAFLCGIIYLAFSARPYKVVLNAEMLDRAVPAETIFLGTIAKIEK